MLNRICFHILALIFLLPLSGFTEEKDKTADSLVYSLLSVNNDTERVDIMLSLAEHYSRTDITKSEEFARHALKLSEDIHYQHGLAYSNLQLSIIFMNYAFDLSEYFLVRSLSLANELDDNILKGKIYNLIGSLKSDIGHYDEALDYFNKSIEIFKELDLDSLTASVYNNIGIAYARMNVDSLSIKYYLNAAAINERSKNFNWLSINYNNLAVDLLSLDSLEEAKVYLDKSLDIAVNNNNQQLLPWLYNNYSRYFFLKSEYVEAVKNARQAGSLARIMKNREQESNSLSWISESFFHMGILDSAYLVYQEFTAINDSLNYHEKISEIEIMEMKYQFENEIELNNLKNRNQKIILLSLITVLVLLTGLIYSLFRSQKLQSTKNQVEKEMLELEKQQLLQEVSLKSRELTSKLMHTASQNVMITKVIDTLIHPDREYLPENQKLINRVVMELKLNLNNNAWKAFEKEFLEVNPGFYQKIGHDFPELTLNDKRLCALLKLNLTTKEISELTRTSTSSIEKARTRLRKRLNLTGTDLSINSFMLKY